MCKNKHLPRGREKRSTAAASCMADLNFMIQIAESKFILTLTLANGQVKMLEEFFFNHSPGKRVGRGDIFLSLSRGQSQRV